MVVGDSTNMGSTGDLPDLTLGGSTDALNSTYPRPPTLTSLDLLNDTDVEQLSLEIEKERGEYLERSRHLQQQLQHLKSEIEVRRSICRSNRGNCVHITSFLFCSAMLIWLILYIQYSYCDPNPGICTYSSPYSLPHNCHEIYCSYRCWRWRKMKLYWTLYTNNNWGQARPSTQPYVALAQAPPRPGLPSLRNCEISILGPYIILDPCPRLN